MKSSLRILYLEDEKNDVELVQAVLEDEGFNFDLINVETRNDFIATLEKGGFNIILSDYNLPSFDGLSALAIARITTPEIPFLFLSGAMGEELAIETLKSGATDYVLKQRLSRLGPAIRRALKEAEEHRERKKAEEELEKYREHLEELIEQRTTELKNTNNELQSVNNKLKAEIEARERMQQALELSEEHYRKMVDAVTSYTYSVEVRKGNAIYTEHSVGCLPVTGYSPNDYKSDPHLWYSMIYADDKAAVEDAVKKIMAGHKILPIEHRIIRRDGAVIWIRNTIVPYYNDDEELVRYEGLIEDITERKFAEEEIQKLNKELEQKLLELTEANKELEAFNRSVSHDLKTPVMVIEGFARRYLKVYGDTLDTDEIDIINTIQMNAHKMERLIKDLLLFSRSGRQEIKSAKIDIMNLVEIVMDGLEPLSEGRRIKFEMKTLPQTYGDIGLMKQVLINLLSNSIKFTQTKEVAVVEIGCNVTEHENIYYIKDNGIGFDSRYADRLFAPFNRLEEARQFDGTGIGLSIVERIIKRHGGRVWAEGKINNGATFYFSLPNKAK